MANRFNQFYIEMLHGRADDEDKERAFDAAMKILDTLPDDVTVKDALVEMMKQSEEGATREEEYTGIAAIVLRADMEANLALTEGWHNPNGASCAVAA